MKNLLVLLFTFCSIFIYSQVGIGTTTPESALDIANATSGLLIPRVALTAKNVAAPVTNPKGGAIANSTLVYNTATAGTSPNNVVPAFYYWDTTLLSWIFLGNDATAVPKEWKLAGNSGTTPGTDFIGTTDSKDFVLKTSSSERFRVLANGLMGVGNTLPAYKLHVRGDIATDDGVYARSLFNVGTSTGTMYSDNIEPWTDNGIRLYDGNSLSHLHLEAVGHSIIQSYGITGAVKNLLENNNTSHLILQRDGSNVGIGSNISPVTKLDVTGATNVSTGYFYGGTSSPSDFELTRTLPTSINNIVEIGNFSTTNGAHNFRLTVTASLPNFSVAKSYTVSASYNQTSNVWQLLQPISSTGSYASTDDFEVDINVNNAITSLRLRKSLGSIGGAIQIRIENIGATTDVFTSSIATAVVTAPTTIFGNNAPSFNWTTSGNFNTNPNINFLGTTDAKDLIFKTNNIQRLKIDNSLNATTGSTGDIEIGDANSGTFRANKELIMRQDGDINGTSILRLRNRNAENGAIYQTTGGPNLVDFIFRTGPIATPITSNIRFETRSGSLKVSGNTTEWQFGQPDNLNGGPTLVVGASGTGGAGCKSSIRFGNFGISNTNPTEKLDVSGNIKFSNALMPNNLPGTIGQTLVSNGAAIAPTWESNPIKPTVKTTLAAIYNVSVNDFTVRISTNATGVNLPNAVGNLGKCFVIIALNGLPSTPFTTSGGTIQDETLASPTITTINSGERYSVQSDGSNWIVIGR